ncbi:MAG: D-alanyl-D-alanine carboxypeptidase, partial [Pseudomonadota bacterium]
MKVRQQRPARLGLFVFLAVWTLVIAPMSVMAAPYAALVMDARTGEVLHSRNADTRLHPASLT